jgi:hypothetical protein
MSELWLKMLNPSQNLHYYFNSREKCWLQRKLSSISFLFKVRDVKKEEGWKICLWWRNVKVKPEIQRASPPRKLILNWPNRLKDDDIFFEDPDRECWEMKWNIQLVVEINYSACEKRCHKIKNYDEIGGQNRGHDYYG